jgi:hypothetical protein
VLVGELFELKERVEHEWLVSVEGHTKTRRVRVREGPNGTRLAERQQSRLVYVQRESVPA